MLRSVLPIVPHQRLGHYVRLSIYCKRCGCVVSDEIAKQGARTKVAKA